MYRVNEGGAEKAGGRRHVIGLMRKWQKKERRVGEEGRVSAFLCIFISLQDFPSETLSYIIILL